MKVLTEEADLRCAHELGKVAVIATQSWVRSERGRLLVRNDPEGRPIAGCPNYGPTIKPCTSTLAVQRGYSTLVRIDGRPVCLESLEGLTDGTPPGSVKYRVRHTGQQLVEVSE
ncbi:hypothetical protein [Marinimicrobium locisalis]|uniref:hypothetical protein n=1 Tax=Marinimicrobium locisalis TaxID=546022 RepID=UPI003221F2E6